MNKYYLVQVVSNTQIGVAYAGVVLAPNKSQAKKFYCQQLIAHWSNLSITNTNPVKISAGNPIKQMKNLKFAISASIQDI